MLPTLHILPETQLKLRRLSSDAAPSRGPMWTLSTLDTRARCLWEIAIDSEDLKTLLENFAEGATSTGAGASQVSVYPDPELEQGVAAWAHRTLACHGDELASVHPKSPIQQNPFQSFPARRA